VEAVDSRKIDLGRSDLDLGRSDLSSYPGQSARSDLGEIDLPGSSSNTAILLVLLSNKSQQNKSISTTNSAVRNPTNLIPR
jgi:hypothetical protein